MTNTNWPTPEELETQQSPFDPQGSYPFSYKIVIVEQVADELFEEQLRTYTINEPLDEANLAIPEDFVKETGRQFRPAQPNEKADMHIMNQETTVPIALVAV